MTFFQFINKFKTEDDAINYFIHVKYNDTLTCPHCESFVKVYRFRKRAKVCQCKNCNNTFSPFNDTIFKKSRTDMRKWFYTIHLVLNGYKGISGCQLQRELGVTYKTAWRMLCKIREAMGNKNVAKTFDCFVEIDETYIGGKPRKQNTHFDKNGNIIPKTKSKRGRGTSKTPVIGVKERGTNRVYAQVALPNEQGQKLSGKQLLAVLDKVCNDGTTVVSDDFTGYGILDKPNVKRYIHFTVSHSLGQFSAGDGIHTNNIENFWSLLKRQFIGTHHHYSVKHMQKYIDEMCFRQSHRGDPKAFDILLKQCIMKSA